MPNRLQPLVVMLVMGLCSLLLVAIAWPSARSASATQFVRDRVVSGQRAAPSATVLTSPVPAGAAVRLLRYTFAPDALPTFDVSIEQTMSVRDGAESSRVVTTLQAQVKVEAGPEPDRVYFLFESFNLSVVADGTPVEIPAVDSLLRGIRVLVTVDARLGLVEDTTLAGVNPQVRRMLALLMDVLRQAHPPLPEEQVADGTTWRQESRWENDDDGQLEAKLLVDMELVPSANAQEAQLRGRTALALDGDQGDSRVKGDGSGQIDVQLDVARGRLLSSEGRFAYQQGFGAVVEGSGPSQWLELRFAIGTR